MLFWQIMAPKQKSFIPFLSTSNCIVFFISIERFCHGGYIQEYRLRRYIKRFERSLLLRPGYPKYVRNPSLKLQATQADQRTS